jgi:hypothetical protein
VSSRWRCTRRRRRRWCWTGLRAVSAAGVYIVAGIVLSSPNDHLAARPYCSVISSCRGRIGGAGRGPTIGAGIVSPAGVQKIRARITEASAPDDHFAAGPDCCVIGYSGRISGAGCCPAIGARVVSPAGAVGVISTPDDHFATRPHCRVTVSGMRCVGQAGGRPTAAARVKPCAVMSVIEEVSAPDNHFATRPYCRVKGSGVERPSGYSRPTVKGGIVSLAGVADDDMAIHPAPDDHFAASPHCGVIVSAIEPVGGAGGRPTIGSRIVSPAGV